MLGDGTILRGKRGTGLSEDPGSQMMLGVILASLNQMLNKKKSKEAAEVEVMENEPGQSSTQNVPKKTRFVARFAKKMKYGSKRRAKKY